MKTRDTVCGLEVTEGGPFRQKYAGREYCFCSPECLRNFRQSPLSTPLGPLATNIGRGHGDDGTGGGSAAGAPHSKKEISCCTYLRLPRR